jgi:hypothetical protein
LDSLKYYPWTSHGRNSTNNFDADAVPHEEMVGKIEQPLLNPHRFSNDHLQLIFEMRRNLEDQLHNQSILNKRMDLMFDSLSGAPDKKHCLLATKCSSSPTTMKDARVRHTSSFSLILFNRNQLQLILVLLKTLVYGNNHVMFSGIAIFSGVWH